MISFLPYVLLWIAFVSTSMWSQIEIFLTRKKPNQGDVKTLTEDKYLKRVKEVGGFTLAEIKIVKSDKPFGMMIGLPGKPIMIFSSNLLETFNEDEIDWVLIHETAHYKFMHSVREMTLSLIILICGTLFLWNLFPLVDNLALQAAIAVGLGFVSGIGGLQIGRLHEYEADNFAAKNMRNPEGMITGTRKLRLAWRNVDHNDKGLFQRVFMRGVSDTERERIASEEIMARKS